MEKEFCEYFKDMDEEGKILINTSNINIEFKNENIFPCFFTGNILSEKSIVTISLNPKYDEQTTRNEQGDDFNLWLDKCLSRFNNYKTDKSLHKIWKNLAKVIFTDEERRNCLRSKLQNKLVNLDWCFYYSKKFTTLAQNAENQDVYELFDKNLNKLLKKINPKVIFAHGKSLNNWFRSNSTDIEEILELEHGSKTYKLFSGCLNNLSIPVIYQEWFINRGNKNTNLEQVRKLLKQYM